MSTISFTFQSEENIQYTEKLVMVSVDKIFTIPPNKLNKIQPILLIYNSKGYEVSHNPGDHEIYGSYYNYLTDTGTGYKPGYSYGTGQNAGMKHNLPEDYIEFNHSYTCPDGEPISFNGITVNDSTLTYSIELEETTELHTVNHWITTPNFPYAPVIQHEEFIDLLYLVEWKQATPSFIPYIDTSRTIELNPNGQIYVERYWKNFPSVSYSYTRLSDNKYRISANGYISFKVPVIKNTKNQNPQVWYSFSTNVNTIAEREIGMKTNDITEIWTFVPTGEGTGNWMWVSYASGPRIHYIYTRKYEKDLEEYEDQPVTVHLREGYCIEPFQVQSKLILAGLDKENYKNENYYELRPK